jgi:hypothetical protein
MVRKFIIPGALAIAAATLAPTAASAESYFTFGLSSDDAGYGYGPGDDYFDDQPAWMAPEGWEQQQRWAEEDARRQYWDDERWEDRQWNDDQDDDDGD